MRIFLVIPFTKEFEDIHYAVRQAVDMSGHTLIRIDELFATGNITDQIHNEINKADLVIADISNQNPNVMYEVGFAQSAQKPILPISEQGQQIPFDIASIRVLIYDRKRLN